MTSPKVFSYFKFAMEYDEQAAINYIRAKVPALAAKDYDDDEVLNVIDMIFDYYEENGFLDLNLDNDGPDELDTADLLAYVHKMVAKDPESPFSVDEVEKIVLAELDYEDSLEA